MLAFTVAAEEAVYTSGGIHEFRFTRIERMRSIGDFHLKQRISFSVNFYSFLCLNGAARDERFVVRHILKHYLAIVFGVQSFFYFVLLLCKAA